MIERFAAFYEAGERGAAGGAASHDKVWGIAVIDNKRCIFWGRRNHKMRFKTMPGKIGKAQSELIYEEKIGGRKSGDIYTPIASDLIRDMLVPNLEAQVTQHFYTDLFKGKVNTRGVVQKK
jgi:hypothetical protein